MGRRLRFIPPGGALVEVTCRTIQGRYLLRPSSEINDLIIGVLARAASRYPVDVHAFIFMSNHYHLLVSVPNAQRLALFMGYLNSNLAREISRKTGWTDKVWGRRYQAIVVSVEPQAQEARLKYILSHGVKEGLVVDPTEWPGAHCISALLEDSPIKGTWFSRTLEWAARQRGEEFHGLQYSSQETLELTPLPCWANCSATTRRHRISELLASICREFGPPSNRVAEFPKGLHAVLNRNPQERPLVLKKAPAPHFHCATRLARQELRQAYTWFVGAYREAADRLRRGYSSASFPAGSLPSPLLFLAHPSSFAPG